MAIVRIEKLDTLKGFVMLLMVLDHSRAYWGDVGFSPTDLSQTTPGWYYTRWITHICAPIFVMLSGVSAFLYERKTASRLELTQFLFTRGLWLIFLEVVVIRFSLEFGWGKYIVLQVIWILGASMIFLSFIVWFPRTLALFISFSIAIGHNLLDSIQTKHGDSWHTVWSLLHQKTVVALTDEVSLYVSYPLIPWIALISIGYLFAKSIIESNKRKRLGFSLIGLLVFLILRASNIYGDPHAWEHHKDSPLLTVMSFLNVTKYPPSLLFLLITLSLASMLSVVLDYIKGWPSRVLNVFGKVPLFFYIIHIPLIFGLVYVWHFAHYGEWYSVNWTHYRKVIPQNLLNTYLVWAVVCLILYLPCKWYGHYKKANNNKILSYL